MSTEKRISGLSELLIDSHRLSDPELIATAAENALFPVSRSVAAIGDLLWHAATNNETVISSNTLADIGLLLSHLGTFIEEVADIESNASFQAYDVRSERNRTKLKSVG